ncbi:hypothetical protein VM1G_11797 [Cytospora mali]|uniref:Uncharacterized protein n=1 Tax=Cytospora mali TaxID=578113 RepID=A0A194W733_CYTMA|nr:hypothetical protein VM1G_11797 [Valsa mali]
MSARHSKEQTGSINHYTPRSRQQFTSAQRHGQEQPTGWAEFTSVEEGINSGVCRAPQPEESAARSNALLLLFLTPLRSGRGGRQRSFTGGTLAGRRQGLPEGTPEEPLASAANARGEAGHEGRSGGSGVRRDRLASVPTHVAQAALDTAGQAAALHISTLAVRTTGERRERAAQAGHGTHGTGEGARGRSYRENTTKEHKRVSQGSSVP